jgi:hypothetical protein
MLSQAWGYLIGKRRRTDARTSVIPTSFLLRWLWEASLATGVNVLDACSSACRLLTERGEFTDLLLAVVVEKQNGRVQWSCGFHTDEGDVHSQYSSNHIDQLS